MSDIPTTIAQALAHDAAATPGPWRIVSDGSGFVCIEHGCKGIADHTPARPENEAA